ncbi:hypothetical protein [Arsenicibacter rosenii]|uniref:Uncharacterized protein n=1 Tax=Arsenicibacter rosenii TaxID=1750698 RepID=A0A1S2VBY2_9BACT|nr:hypothetical protein [Arsenicibacter rosenii]OIN55736.1 hypothetical protein BLX24_28385 [Arsenicibacter rosenii]
MTTVISTTAQYNLSQIMSDAWTLVRQAGQTISDALRAVWAKARTAVHKLNIDITKLETLTIQELKDLQAVLTLTIQDREEKESRFSGKKFAHKIKLEVKDGLVKTTSYYNTDFVIKARGLRGKWQDNQWVFEADVLEHVRQAMLSSYSVTGAFPYEVCTLVVKDYYQESSASGVELFGRPVAKAFGRDSGAKPQEGIFLVSGKFRSGGSVKNWKTVVDATFEIHDFPVAALDREDVKKAIAEGWVEVK